MPVQMHFLAQKDRPTPRTQMMSFLIVTEHRHAIVIDGGNKQDTEYFHGYIQGLLGPRPHIDLWILTHAHEDHTDVLYEMLRRFPDDFTLDTLVYHFPSCAFARQYDPDSAHTVTELEELKPVLLQKGTRLCVPEKGDVLEVDGVRLTVLRTFNPQFTGNVMNNASMVFRMDACGQSVLFTGDLGIEGGEETLRTVPAELLRCDFVQMAHHGQQGVNRRFYEAVHPKACLWATPLWLWENNAGKGFDTHIWKTVEVRGWIEEMGVKHHFINKDGTQVIELPYPFEKR